ncbi:MAG: hypothetical protein R3234_13340 [Thermoanaerobaculia bacterium]|nr:hypothetical protein [Thermoanaerobaculia bacterium]
MRVGDSGFDRSETGCGWIALLVVAGLILGPLPGGTQTPAGVQDLIATHAAEGALFVASDRCLACHNGLTTSRGEDVSIGIDWRSSMMANAARDPYWQAAVRREILDHPEARAAIEDKCSTCHMPMARFTSRAAGGEGEVFRHLPIADQVDPLGLLAADGTSCSVCHQIQAEGLGEEESFTGGFVVAPAGAVTRPVYGPFQVDPGRSRVMSSATGFEPRQASHVQTSELCAPCHTLYTHALGPGGEEIGELPEQMPYREWSHSAYPGEERSCQSCHMPRVEEPTPISSVVGEAREGLSRHVFRGGNFFMPRIFNRFRAELGVVTPAQELDLMASRTLEHLAARSGRLEVEVVDRSREALVVEVRVENLAGHKLPSAYPSRRAWIRLVVRDGEGRTVFESGAFRPTGAVAGNDNDEDPELYEPHYDEITSPEEVQIYEAILEGPEGEVTTGLLTGTGYAKDNRLLPRGFEKSTADPDIAVRGAAARDATFVGGTDRLRYRMDLRGRSDPMTVEAELWYQPIAFRWAMNLDEYEAPETRRFVRYYRTLSDLSATVLARASVRAP